jgi:FkbM family methyltransferase
MTDQQTIEQPLTEPVTFGQNMNSQPVTEQLIFDIGMHTGRDTEFYLKKGFKVVAIEANPQLVKSAHQKFRDYIQTGKLEIFEVAIAENMGEIEFYVNDQHDDWGTISKEFAQRNEKIGTSNSVIKVQCSPLRNILEKFPTPYYVKIDIEGADVLCLKDLFSLSQRPRYVSIEAGLNSFEETFTELSLLWNLGYKHFKIVNQALNQSVKCPNPSLEGSYVDYKFDGTCSGPFGEEAPGYWLGVEEALMRYRKILWESKYFGANGRFYRTFLHKSYNALKGTPVGWYDFHAKLG